MQSEVSFIRRTWRLDTEEWKACDHKGREWTDVAINQGMSAVFQKLEGVINRFSLCPSGENTMMLIACLGPSKTNFRHLSSKTAR